MPDQPMPIQPVPKNGFQKTNFFGCAESSNVELLENATRDRAKDKHDDGPECRDVDDVLSLLYRLEDSVGDIGRRGEERILRQMRGHGSGNESGLDGEDVNAAAVDTIAHAVEEAAERALRGSVDVVAFAAAIASHRRDDSQRSLTRGLKVVREP